MFRVLLMCGKKKNLEAQKKAKLICKSNLKFVLCSSLHHNIIKCRIISLLLLSRPSSSHSFTFSKLVCRWNVSVFGHSKNLIFYARWIYTTNKARESTPASSHKRQLLDFDYPWLSSNSSFSLQYAQHVECLWNVFEEWHKFEFDTLAWLFRCHKMAEECEFRAARKTFSVRQWNRDFYVIFALANDWKDLSFGMLFLVYTCLLELQPAWRSCRSWPSQRKAIEKTLDVLNYTAESTTSSIM